MTADAEIAAAVAEIIIKILAVSAAILFAAALIHQWLIRRGTLRRCPYCRSVIPGDASVCKDCNRDL